MPRVVLSRVVSATNLDSNAKASSSSLDLEQLHVGMVMRAFSPHGGLELYAHKLIEGLLDKGVKVTVICQNIESGLKHPNLAFIEFDKPPKGLSKAQRVQQLFDSANQVLKKHGDGFSLIHSQHLPTELANVVTFHNHTVGRLSEVGKGWERALNDFKVNFASAYKLRDKFDGVLCRTADCLVFVSKRMQEDYYKRYNLSSESAPEAKSYVVAYPGASLPPVDETKPAKSESPSLFTFLFVGKGFRKKGLDVLFESCAHLRRNGKNFRLIIAGLKERPLDKLRLTALNISENVEYLGFQKDMAAVYARAQSIILPSRIEPFGMAPVQAMTFGLVPIVSSVTGVSEVLHDGEDALFLSDHLNSSELAAQMQRLMEEKGLLEKLSAKAVTTARSVSWDATVNQTLKAYEAVMSVRK